MEKLTNSMQSWVALVGRSVSCLIVSGNSIRSSGGMLVAPVNIIVICGKLRGQGESDGDRWRAYRAVSDESWVSVGL